MSFKFGNERSYRFLYFFVFHNMSNLIQQNTYSKQHGYYSKHRNCTFGLAMNTDLKKIILQYKIQMFYFIHFYLSGIRINSVPGNVSDNKLVNCKLQKIQKD